MYPSKNTLAVMTLVIASLYFLITQCAAPPPPSDDPMVKPELAAVMEYLKQEDYTNNPNWHLFPGTDVSPGSDTLKRLGLPVHGRWVRTYVNNVANQYLLEAIDGKHAQPLDFPIGSFIVKQNYRSDFDTIKSISSDRSTLGVITLLYKPDPKFDYCVTNHLTPYNGVDCYGGDWFYGFFFQDDLVKGQVSPSSSMIQANVNSFCVNCHAPGFNTDYVRTLDDILNPSVQASKTPYCDRFDPPAAFNAQLIAAKEPSDMEAFKAQLDAYVNDNSLSPVVPGDVPADPSVVLKFFGKELTQLMFDSYAWKSFIALNWPNKGLNPNTQKPQRGEGDPQLPFSANEERATVWETYKPTFEVFQPGDVNWDPAKQPWNQVPPLPAGANCGSDNNFVVSMSSKTRDVVNETGQAFAGTFGYLVDQDSNRVRYEVLFNRTEFEYLIDDGRAASVNLTPAGPKNEVNKVNFPDNRDDTKYGQGAIEVKSAWKELCLTADCNHRDAEDLAAAKKKFLVRKTLIYNADSTRCREANMGLVGLHIARKTYYAPQWVWITFEHQENVPDAGAENPTGTFYNPDLQALEDCYELPFLANKPGIASCPNVDLNRFVDNLAKQPNQLTRMAPIPTEAQQLNTAFQKALKAVDSPYANYVLVNAQWPLNGRGENGQVNTIRCKDNAMGSDCYTAEPRFLRNSVIESYMSNYCNFDNEVVQFSNRSCMTCHASAGANLSYVWLDAVSQRVKLQ